MSEYKVLALPEKPTLSRSLASCYAEEETARYEHKLLLWRIKVEQSLNEFGAEGWRLINVVGDVAFLEWLE